MYYIVGRAKSRDGIEPGPNTKAQGSHQPAARNLACKTKCSRKKYFSTYFAILFGKNFFKKCFLGCRSTSKSHKLNEKSLEKRAKSSKKLANYTCYVLTRSSHCQTQPNPSPQKSGSKPSLAKSEKSLPPTSHRLHLTRLDLTPVLPQGFNEKSQIFFQKVAKFAKKFFTT